MNTSAKTRSKRISAHLFKLNLNIAAMWTMNAWALPTAAAQPAPPATTRADETSEEPEVGYRAPISGWRLGFGLGHSPACFGSKREFGHYRCGGYSEIFISPPGDQSITIKGIAHDLKAARIVGENPQTKQRIYEMERLNLSGLQLGKSWNVKSIHYGFGAGIFGGSIERTIEAEDQFGDLKPDEHGRSVAISGYVFSAAAGTTLARTEAGDFLMDLNQTWYVTTEADNPRDERRVWASMPTLAFGWSHQFK